MLSVLFEMAFCQRSELAQSPSLRVTCHHVLPVLLNEALLFSIVVAERLIQARL